MHQTTVCATPLRPSQNSWPPLLRTVTDCDNVGVMDEPTPLQQLLEHKRPTIQADVNAMLAARKGWRTIAEHVRSTTGISVSHETLRRWYGKVDA